MDYKAEPRQRDTDRVVEKARAALKTPVLHITDMQSPRNTGEPRDYYSNGDYWWPNPDTPDGLPYMQRDGQTNPDNFNGHRIIMRQIHTNVVFLTSAYVPIGGEQYAVRAVRHLGEFFLNRDTYMTSRLSHAQAILGICPGRGIGIISTFHLVDVMFAIERLRKSPSMEPEVYEGLKKWFARYLRQVLTDASGVQETNKDNNHGACFFVQTAAFARFTDDERVVDFCREYYKKGLSKQEAKDDSFSRELGRTKPYNYSLFIVDNMVSMCHPLSSSEDDPWEYESPDGRSMKKTLDFITPYVLDKKCWPYPPGVMHFDAFPARYGFMVLAGCTLGRRELLDLYGRPPAESANEEAGRSIAPRQPMLWV